MIGTSMPKSVMSLLIIASWFAGIGLGDFLDWIIAVALAVFMVGFCLCWFCGRVMTDITAFGIALLPAQTALICLAFQTNSLLEKTLYLLLTMITACMSYVFATKVWNNEPDM